MRPPENLLPNGSFVPVVDVAARRAIRAGAAVYLWIFETCRNLPALRGCDKESYILVQRSYTPVQAEPPGIDKGWV